MQVISAFEIGEFYYCNLVWWFKKQGTKIPDIKEIERKLKVEKKPQERIKLVKQLQISKKIKENLEIGVKRHETIGKKIEIVQQKEVQINYLKYIWYIPLGQLRN